MMDERIYSKSDLVVKINLPIYLFVVFYLFSTIRSFLRGFGASSELIWIAMGVFLYLPLLALIIKKYRSLCYKNLLLFIFVIAYILVCMRVYSYYSIYYNESNGIEAAILTGCSSVFSLLFIGLYFDEDSIYNAINYTAVVNLIINILKMRLILTQSTAFLKYGYDMDFGYKVLFSCIVFLSIYLRTHKKFSLLMSCVCLVLLLLFGSRGPLLCIVVYTFLYFLVFHFKEYTKRKKIIITISFLSFLLLVFFYYYYIAPMIDLSKLPRSVRTILNIRYTDGTVESRLMIQRKVYDIINQNGFFGSGLLSDQANLGAGFYSHNLFIEFMITFGKIPGIIISVYLAIKSFIILRNQRISDTAKNVYIIFLSLCFRLMVSYSFWYDMNFWCFIAIGNVLLMRANHTNNTKVKVV